MTNAELLAELEEISRGNRIAARWALISAIASMVALIFALVH